MILKGNQRGGGADLAAHLMKAENEHIDVHELRGFVSDDLSGALNEIYAVSRGTRCRQYLYSLSLNPPIDRQAPTEAFEAAIDRVEVELGLSEQPRAIVFHEKEGRRHAHCVWSRIKVSEMKAVQMSFDHQKLKTISRDLYLEHGWKMPEGLAHRERRDPRNYDLAAWQQARRLDRHPHATKRDFEDAWAMSDGRETFVNALRERGYEVARGNRRGFVAVNEVGEVFSIPRQVGVKTKEVRGRLGEPKELPEVEDVKREYRSDMIDNATRLKGELEARYDDARRDFERKRSVLVETQRREREALESEQTKRNEKEVCERQSRFRKGIAGLWDRVNGTHRKISKQNALEAEAGLKRDTQEQDALIFRHLGERQRLSLFRKAMQQDYTRERTRLERDFSTFVRRDLSP